jgi:hypothetical protein
MILVGVGKIGYNIFLIVFYQRKTSAPYLWPTCELLECMAGDTPMPHRIVNGHMEIEKSLDLWHDFLGHGLPLVEGCRSALPSTSSRAFDRTGRYFAPFIRLM